VPWRADDVSPNQDGMRDVSSCTTCASTSAPEVPPQTPAARVRIGTWRAEDPRRPCSGRGGHAEVLRPPFKVRPHELRDTRNFPPLPTVAGGHNDVSPNQDGTRGASSWTVCSTTPAPRASPRPVQLALTIRTWGGRRPGAGRPRKPGSGPAHRRQPAAASRPWRSRAPVSCERGDGSTASSHSTTCPGLPVRLQRDKPQGTAKS
jgi:hypothetical protein